MAITAASCCFSLPSPSLSPSSNPSKLCHTSGGKEKVAAGSWRKQYVLLGMTCVIMGTDMMMPGIENYAVAAENKSVTAQVEESKKRWSDKRGCPPWNVNSLEIVVPENLPRPYSHRRSEAVAQSKSTSIDRRIRLVLGSKGKCFSM